MENSNHLCSYCNQPASFQLKNGKWCCMPFNSQCPALRKKNQEAIKNLYKNGKLNQQEIQKHRTKESLIRQGWNKGLTKYTSNSLKERGEKLSQRYKNGELKPSWKGRTHTVEEIDKIVTGMTHFRIGKNLKGFKHGWYKGYWCDSSWELAFVMYNIDHNIEFKRNIEGFTYVNNAKTKRYYPDFIVNETYIEIKGYKNAASDLKINSFPKDKKLIILYRKEMKKYLDYAKETYGKEFWTLLENKE